ncbi:MAG TPA: glycosyltransferase family 2 protein [Desulfotomaculum sp.]|nr:glycosyltransferase family 2 protein [Desulfotomaculum sp.]
MYKGAWVSLVIPAYNEERLIGATLAGVPSLVDRIFVIDDCSTDQTPIIVQEMAKKDNRIKLIQHATNQGPGGGIITGYLASARERYDIAAVVGGDNQMGFEYLPELLDPIIAGEADYTKGNRFLKGRPKEMPFKRLFGNFTLSWMTKIASGYWRIFDTQDGYTAISRRAIEAINWTEFWRGYGYVSDFLIRFNTYRIRIKDIYRKEIYLPGEKQSQIKIGRYIRLVGPMIIRGFFWRLKQKYFQSPPKNLHRIGKMELKR